MRLHPAKSTEGFSKFLGFVAILAVLVPLFQNCSQFSAVPSEAVAVSSTSAGNTLREPATAVPTPTPSLLPTPTPAPQPFANLIWSDEFDTMSWFNSVTGIGNWTTTSINKTPSGRGWGAEYDLDSSGLIATNPFTVSGGIFTLRTDRASTSIQPSIGGFQFTSGAMRTVNPSFGYGYYEMRAQMPKGNGLWPAFWMLPADGAWPPEIDIMEGLGNSPTTVFTTVHSTAPFAGSYQPYSGHFQLGAAVPTPDLTSGYHVYGLSFAADKITWYFDGTQIFQTVTPSDLIGRKMYLIIDTAIGGWGRNTVDSTTPFPALYKIDYIRAYSSRP